jgi:hypothetical protein
MPNYKDSMEMVILVRTDLKVAYIQDLGVKGMLADSFPAPRK